MITDSLLSITNTFKAIRALGLTARYRDGEWRINYRNGREGTAYYTTDAQDAVATALVMAESITKPSA